MDDRPIVDAMIRYGGSFVHDLGLLFLRADEDNRARLRAAFPDLWTEYADIARLHAARQANGEH
jgi:hypothetical protein